MTITEVLTDRTPHIALSRSDVEAIATYVWTHTRSSPNGRGYKVWLRMHDFLNAGNGDDYAPTDVLPLFRENEDD